MRSKVDECISVLKFFVEKMTEVIMKTLVNHSEAFQSEIFTMKKEFGKEKNCV